MISNDYSNNVVEQENREVKNSLGYITSLEPGWAICDPVSKKKHSNEKKFSLWHIHAGKEKIAKEYSNYIQILIWKSSKQEFSSLKASKRETS